MAALGLGEVGISGGSITTTAAPEHPSVVTRGPAAEAIYLRGLSVRRATLEDAFLQLTHGAEQR